MLADNDRAKGMTDTMPLAPFDGPEWYRALTLTERAGALGHRADTLAHDDAVRAMCRLRRWREQTPLADDRYFAQRLTVDSIDEAGLRRLLGEPIEAVRDGLSQPPAWLQDLADAFARHADAATTPLATPGNRENAPFLDLIAPLIARAGGRVDAGVGALAGAYDKLPFDPATVVDLLFAHVPEQLQRMLGRTMVLELHVARLRGLLRGESAEERFESFLDRIRNRREAIDLLRDYPVLARQLVHHLGAWGAVSLEFLGRLCADWLAIQATFARNDAPGVLVALDGGAGDKHRGGRAVHIATFTSGFRLVYKPRSLAVDAHFQELLGWLNARGARPAFRSLTLLERGAYGWTEYVPATPCASEAEVRRFYERQGGPLALLYALEATDIHAENVLAAGEHPVLLDLEALFHPRIAEVDSRQAGDIASGAANYSVLRAGLLPYRMWADGESEGVDLSGLGAAGGQFSAHAVPRWEAVGTDEMRLIRKRVDMPGEHNRPSLDGVDVDVLAYAGAVRDGFATIYRLLLAHRDELLADGGPLARFASDDVRVIVRDTQMYSVLLRESFHPDALRDGLDRDRLFDRLWAGIDYRPNLARLIRSEHADLQDGDIPLFTTRPASRDVWDSRGRPVEGFLDEGGLGLVRRRLLGFEEADLQRQLWFIHAAFATLGRGETRARWSPYHLDRGAPPATPDRLLAAARAVARAVGDRLEALAVRGAHDASWISLMLTAKDHWTLQPAGLDLYDGLPGIALFLAYLGAVTEDRRYTRLSRAAFVAVRSQLAHARVTLASIGAFDGWGGIIYALTHLGALWDDATLLDEAEDIVSALPPLIGEDTSFDIIGGAAGCIATLAGLYRHRPNDRTLRVAIACGDRLIARAEPLERGVVGWSKSMALQRPLTGFSHGAAGIAWALLELAALSGFGRFRATALEALAYERALYMETEGNRPDLRVLHADHGAPAASPSYRAMWCHGAAGIGLGRLSSLRLQDDATSRAEIAAALRTTAARGFGESHALCHGNLGNLELLVQAGRVLGDARWRDEAWRMASAILASIERSSWVCGTSLAVESPGLMTGLARMGYGLLRLAAPAPRPGCPAARAGRVWRGLPGHDPRLLRSRDARLRLPRGLWYWPRRRGRPRPGRDRAVTDCARKPSHWSRHLSRICPCPPSRTGTSTTSSWWSAGHRTRPRSLTQPSGVAASPRGRSTTRSPASRSPSNRARTSSADTRRGAVNPGLATYARPRVRRPACSCRPSPPRCCCSSSGWRYPF